MLLIVNSNKITLNISFSHPWLLIPAFMKLPVTLEVLFWAWVWCILYWFFFLWNPLILAKLLGSRLCGILLLKMKLFISKKHSSCVCTLVLWNKQKCWKNDIGNSRNDETILWMRCFHSIHHSFWLFPKWGVIFFCLPFLND